MPSASIIPLSEYTSNTPGFQLALVEDLRQQTYQQNSSSHDQQAVSGKLNVFALKSSQCNNTTTSLGPTLLSNASPSSIENLPPQDNISLSQSAAASRANVGCGKAISCARSVSQGAYIIPTTNTIPVSSSVSSRVPLATLQQSSGSYIMSRQNLISAASYSKPKESSMPHESDMEQDENNSGNSAQNSQVFQLLSHTSAGNAKSSKSSISNASSSYFKPPAAKKIKLRDSWHR